MTTLQVQGSVVWIAMSLLVYWNFSTCFSSLLVMSIWVITVAALSSAVGCVLRTLEWVCGARGHNTHRPTEDLDVVLEGQAMGSIFNIVTLVYFAGTTVTTLWRDALFAVVVMSSWAARVEGQAAAWAHNYDWRFRVVAVVSCCLALMCAALQWSFFATILPPSDEANETVCYVLTVWFATLVIRLIQSLTFEVLHILCATSWARSRGSSEFDPMDEVGLSVRSAGAALSFIVAMVYCPNGAVTLAQLTVVRLLFVMINALSALQRFKDILHSFPEVNATGYCVICLESVDTSEPARKLRCGHIFHSRCLRRWLMRSNHCPTCRHPANEQGRDTMASVGFGFERHSVRQRALHASQDAAVQTTFDLEYNLRPALLHGSLRPLTRSTNSVTEAALAFADINSNNPNSNNSINMCNSVNAYDDDDDRRSNTLSVGLQQRTVLPLSHRQPFETRAPTSLFPLPTATRHAALSATEPDEFSDKPILQKTRKVSRRKRDDATAKSEKAATVAASAPEHGKGEEKEEDEDGRGMIDWLEGIPAPQKKMRLENTQSGIGE